MAGSVYVPLSGPAREALVKLSEQEFRSPRDQAALLLTKSLQQAGVLEPSKAPAE